ncbi:MAG: sigma-E processing peptidase SpoIIGA [Alicyclobacillus sp.]|nr:sigma-E processing peptidase SpoIIGA [Alicyclobacillus sp.]
MPVIYVDIVFVVNLAMDGVILAATCWTVRRRIRPWRLLCGSLFGAVYGLAMFVPHAALFTTWFGKALSSLAMVVVAIPFRNWLDLARNVAVFYCVTFLVAGAALAMHFAVPAMTLMQGTVVHGGRLAFATSIGGFAVVLAIPIGLWLLHVAIGRIRTVVRAQAALCSVTAVLGDRTVGFTGLLDTGNQLRDPLSHTPVCLVDAAVWRQLVPGPLGALADVPEDDMLAQLQQVASESVPRLSLVPFRGAGGVQKVTVAVRPDALTLQLSDGRERSVGPCLLALHAAPLAVDGRFQAVLHTDLMAGDERYEEPITYQPPQSRTPDSAATSVDSHSTSAPGGR